MSYPLPDGNWQGGNEDKETLAPLHPFLRLYINTFPANVCSIRHILETLGLRDLIYEALSDERDYIDMLALMLAFPCESTVYLQYLISW